MLHELILSWKNIVNFSGRTRRREYWVANCWNNTIMFLVYIFYFSYVSWYRESIKLDDLGSGSLAASIGAIVISIVAIVCWSFANVLYTSLSFRRCHDVGLPGWVYLLCMLGICCCGIGGIVWLVICCLDSKEDNQWGEDPKRELRYDSVGSIVVSIIVFSITLLAYLIVGMDYYAKGYTKNYDYSERLESIIGDDDTTEHEEVSSANVVPAEFSGKDWQSFQVAIDGKVLTLPCTYEEIQKLGFSLENYMLDATLPSNQYTYFYLVKDKNNRCFYVSFLNVSGAEKPMYQCDVCGVKFDESDKLPSVEICGGLTMGMTIDEAKATQGNEPDYEYTSKESDYQSLEYDYNGNSNYGGMDVKITEGKVSAIELKNMMYYLRDKE